VCIHSTLWNTCCKTIRLQAFMQQTCRIHPQGPSLFHPTQQHNATAPYAAAQPECPLTQRSRSNTDLDSLVHNSRHQHNQNKAPNELKTKYTFRRKKDFEPPLCQPHLACNSTGPKLSGIQTQALKQIASEKKSTWEEMDLNNALWLGPHLLRYSC
jgi:hypothetical protein